MQPLNVTRRSLVRTLQENGLILYKANKSNNWEGYISMLIYYTG